MSRAVDPGSLCGVAISTPPPFVMARRSRCSRRQKAGLAFERNLRRALAAPDPPWISYADRRGTGFAQPDLVVPLRDNSILLLEAKLKLTGAALQEARRQLYGLYLPLLRRLHGSRPFRCGIVGKYLDTGVSATPLEELTPEDLDESEQVLFWDSQSPLRHLLPEVLK